MDLNHTVDIMEWARLRLAELRMEKTLLQEENARLKLQIATLERIIERATKGDDE